MQTGHHKASTKRSIVELARQWPLYFSRIFPVSVCLILCVILSIITHHRLSVNNEVILKVLLVIILLQCGYQHREVEYLAIAHSGLHLLHKEENQFQIMQTLT